MGYCGLSPGLLYLTRPFDKDHEWPGFVSFAFITSSFGERFIRLSGIGSFLSAVGCSDEVGEHSFGE